MAEHAAATPEARNLARLQDLYGEYASGNRAPLYAALTEDAVWHSNGDGTLPWSGQWRGRAGVEEYYAVVDGCARVVGYEVGRIIAQGDWVVALATAHVQSLATGETHPYSKVDVFRLEDGRIAEFRESFGTAAAAARFCGAAR